MRIKRSQTKKTPKQNKNPNPTIPPKHSSGEFFTGTH